MDGACFQYLEMSWESSLNQVLNDMVDQPFAKMGCPHIIFPGVAYTYDVMNYTRSGPQASVGSGWRGSGGSCHALMVNRQLVGKLTIDALSSWRIFAFLSFI